MDDGLDQYIAEKKREREECLSEIAGHETAITTRRASVAQLDRLIAALEEAARLRPDNSPAVATQEQKPPRPDPIPNGEIRKPEGAITYRWRDVLRVMARENVDYPPEDIAQLAANVGIATTPRSVRDRMREYIRRGFIDEGDPGFYGVTQEAIDRFGLLEE